MSRNKEQWRELIAEQQSSGLSAVAYCRQHGINPKYFSTQKTRLQSSNNHNFVRLAPPAGPAYKDALQTSKAASTQSRIRVIEIELGDAFDARSLSLMLDQVLS